MWFRPPGGTSDGRIWEGTVLFLHRRVLGRVAQQQGVALSPSQLSKRHLFPNPYLPSRYTPAARATGYPQHKYLFVCGFVFIYWHLNSSLWFRFEASMRQMRLAKVGMGATPLFHPPAPSLAPPAPLYINNKHHQHLWNFLLPQGLILCCFIWPISETNLFKGMKF